jgi:hypothetical protein
MGDARLDYAELTYGFFDRFLKGEKKGEKTAALDTRPKVTYFTMVRTSGSRQTHGRRAARSR